MLTLILAAIFLASLELLLNEAPGRGWRGAFVFTVAGICAASALAGVWRALGHAMPFVDLQALSPPQLCPGLRSPSCR